MVSRYSLVFFFNDTATTEIYTLPYTTLFRSRLPTQARDADRRDPQAARPGQGRQARQQPARRDRRARDGRPLRHAHLGDERAAAMNTPRNCLDRKSVV